MEARLNNMHRALNEKKRKRERFREAYGVLQSMSTQEMRDLDLENSDEIITLLCAKFGWKTLLLIGQLVSKLPLIISRQIEKQIISSSIVELSKTITLDELHLVKLLLARCTDFLEFSYEKSLAAMSISACIPLQRILYPPTTICYSCGSNLQLQNQRPARIAVFEKEGPVPGIKFTLRCRPCNLNYGFSMFGNGDNGYRFYKTRRPYIESSNVTYLARGLCLEQIYLA